MVPGKIYKPEDYTEMVWRRRWLLLLPFLLTTVAGFSVSQFLPNRYVSDALILIIPQRVPNNLVQNTVASALGERLASISAQILSRTQLERVINEFDLYPGERANGELMEDILTQMRLDINVSTQRGRRGPAQRFTVSYESERRETAMEVAQRLASLFIQENLEERELQADATTRFLASQLNEARRGLIETEQRLRKFRTRYAGQLPSQLESNLTVLQSTQTQRRSLIEATNRLIDRRIVLERVISDTEGQMAMLSVPGALDELPADATAAQQLEAAQAALRNLELRFRSEHPDVIGTKQIIAELERKAEAEALAQPLVPGGNGQTAMSSRSPLEDRLAGYRLELETVERQIAAQQEDQAELDMMLNDYRDRIEATPSRESERAELTRDYSTLQGGYSSLLQKNEQAKIGLNLERRQIGEQFRMIDAPRLPQRPVSPNRLRITLMAAMIGLGFGAGIAFLLEYRDTSLRSMEDVVVSLSLPVLAVVPSMTSDWQKRQRHVVGWLTVSVAGVGAIGLVAAAWRLGILEGLVDRVL